MKLRFVGRKEKEVEGTRYVRATYSLGGYTVTVDDSFYEGGASRRWIGVHDFSDSYLPEIYYRDGVFGQGPVSFEVQTVSYGAMDACEFKKFVEAQQKALEAVEILTREFCGEGALAK